MEGGRVQDEKEEAQVKVGRVFIIRDNAIPRPLLK